MHALRTGSPPQPSGAPPEASGAPANPDENATGRRKANPKVCGGGHKAGRYSGETGFQDRVKNRRAGRQATNAGSTCMSQLVEMVSQGQGLDTTLCLQSAHKDSRRVCMRVCFWLGGEDFSRFPLKFKGKEPEPRVADPCLKL